MGSAAALAIVAVAILARRVTRPAPAVPSGSGSTLTAAPPPRPAASAARAWPRQRPPRPAPAASAPLAAPELARLSAATARAGRCLAARDRMAPDALWALGQAEALDDPSLSAAWERHVGRLDPGTPLRRLFDPAAPPAVRSPLLAEPPSDPAGRLFTLMLEALTCTGTEPSPRLVAYVAEPSLSGYALTHQFFAIEWARRAGCKLPAAWTARQAELVEDVLEELDDDTPFDDLFAERLFLVALAGRSDRLRPAWIDRILQHQGEDGCWVDAEPASVQLGDAGFQTKHDADHTTALALYAVARYRADRR